MNNSTTEQPSSMVDGPLFVSMIVINTFSGVLATILNLLIIVTFVKTPSLRTAPNILILSLAITDFSVGVLVQPVHCTFLFSHMTNNTAVYESVFEVLNPILVILILASILTITAITVDRFLAVHLHLRYQELVTKKRISIVVIMIWTFSVLWTCLLLLLTKMTIVIVHIDNFLFLSLLLMNIALVLKISCVIRQHAAQIQVQQQAMNAQPGAAGNIKRSVNIMYYVLGTFCICYSPHTCVWIMKAFMPKLIKGLTALTMVNTILMLNSSINPIIYFWRIPDMRNAALQLLRCFRRNDNHRNSNNDANANADNNVNHNNNNFRL
ncbi:beta-4C adrenergic receptor-like [Exaiptasia diaphana]|uniref:G-protein coupled receptors family 1 profile domain-containing protein n=1 Tax=Exaiptasia diaphana TaxID=2652724 RepID=A0A913YD31_EXADI|nr:beta-4C adrenergic receptor-like [Exaiptasia diaphana]XP_028512432.1 beta-4C adrenergic receptor-like [Exaiptasia diaphana]